MKGRPKEELCYAWADPLISRLHGELTIRRAVSTDPRGRAQILMIQGDAADIS